MADLAQSIQNIADWITLHLTVWILIGTGLYLTVRSRFMQIRQFPEMIRSISGSRGGAMGGISSFQAFTISLAARVGVGNVFGVAHGWPRRDLLDVGCCPSRYVDRLFRGHACADLQGSFR